jgi:hypothetical protein
LFGLGILDTLVVYATDICGYKSFISFTLSFVLPTLHQGTVFTNVIILFALLQSIGIMTTSLGMLTSAFAGSPKYRGLVLPLTRQKTEDERSPGTLLGHQFTQAFLMDVIVSSVYFRSSFILIILYSLAKRQRSSAARGGLESSIHSPARGFLLPNRLSNLSVKQT